MNLLQLTKFSKPNTFQNDKYKAKDLLLILKEFVIEYKD